MNTEKALFIAPDADIIGDVTLEEDSSVWYHAVLRAENAAIKIGKNSNIQDLVMIHAEKGFPVTVGEGVTVGHAAILHGCEVGDNSLIGMGSILLNGASIGKDCIVAAGALVTQNTMIPDGSMVMGSPAKVVRSLRPEEMEENRASAQEYLEFATGKMYETMMPEQ